MTPLDWVALVAYLLGILWIGYSASKDIQTLDDFAIAGGRVPWVSLFATMAASYIGGGASMGTVEKAYGTGYSFFAIMGAFSVSMTLTGLYVAPRLKAYRGAYTVADVMGFHYGRSVRAITGVLSIAVCSGIMGAQAVALALISEKTLGIPFIWGIVVGTGAMVLYTAAGGMWAVVKTDVFKFGVLGVSLPIITYFLMARHGGPGVWAANIPSQYTTFMGDMTMPAFTSAFLAFLLGETLVPPYASRAFIAETPAAARKGTAISGLFGLGWTFVMVSLGVALKAVNPSLKAADALYILISTYLPHGWKGLAYAGLLAVIMSTADSYLNSTATSFVQDIWRPFVNPGISDKQALSLGRWTTVVVGVGAIVFALRVPSIIDALIYSYYFWAPTVLFPLVYAVVRGKASPYTGLSSIVAGGLVTAWWTWVLKEPYGWSGLAAGSLANLATIIIVEALISRATPKWKGIVPERTFSKGVTLLSQQDPSFFVKG